MLNEHGFSELAQNSEFFEFIYRLCRNSELFGNMGQIDPMYFCTGEGWTTTKPLTHNVRVIKGTVQKLLKGFLLSKGGGAGVSSNSAKGFWAEWLSVIKGGGGYLLSKILKKKNQVY